MTFVVVDDDMALHPFTVATAPHLQDSDDPFLNPLAQAYLRPPWDAPSGPKFAPFNRNLLDAEDESQLVQGRDVLSAPAYWSAYFQGAFQFDPVNTDVDPNSEAGVLGWTPLPFGSGFGSLIFLESLREVAAVLPYCLDWVLVHEIGHQLGLAQNTGGIMFEFCVNTSWFFTDAHLAAIRSVTQPPGMTGVIEPQW